MLLPVENVPAGGGGVILGFALAGAAMGILCFVDGAIEWRKRHAAVVADGWRPAEALVFTPGHRADTSKVSIRFRDHSRILLYPRASTHGSPPGDRGVPGGLGRRRGALHGRALPAGRVRPWPYAVPVVGYEPRVTS